MARFLGDYNAQFLDMVSLRRMHRRSNPVRVCRPASRGMLMICEMCQLYAFSQGCHVPVVEHERDAMQLVSLTSHCPRRKLKAFRRRTKEERIVLSRGFTA